MMMKISKGLCSKNELLRRRIRTGGVALATVMTISIPAILSGAPVGTAFTYQGQLEQGGVAANGVFDFEVSLYDDPQFGNMIGVTSSFEDETLDMGLFTLELDFGDVFANDTAVWAEIAVREGASTGSFTTLAPRQPLRPAPFSQRATRAGLAAEALEADNADLLDGRDASAFLETTGGTLTGHLELQDARLELREGNHFGGEIFADVDGLTVSTPGLDRVRIQSELHTTEAVGVGVDSPLQMLDVDGAIQLGDTQLNVAGTMRWNGTDFEGFAGGQWKSFTSSGSASKVGVSSFSPTSISDSLTITHNLGRIPGKIRIHWFSSRLVDSGSNRGTGIFDGTNYATVYEFKNGNPGQTPGVSSSRILVVDYETLSDFNWTAVVGDSSEDSFRLDVATFDSAATVQFIWEVE